MELVNDIIKNPSGWDSLDNYMGETEFGEWRCLLTQNRDSGTVTRSNFISAMNELDGEDSLNVKILRFGHWACGWWEMIAVKHNTREHLEALDIEKRMKDYPVVNEDHLSELEWNETQDYWNDLSLREKVDLCKEHNISIFSARLSYIPDNDTGTLYEYLRG